VRGHGSRLLPRSGRPRLAGRRVTLIADGRQAGRLAALRTRRVDGRARRVLPALQDSPRAPELLDGLSQSLRWLGERDAATDRRREAHTAYELACEARNAGRVATYLAGDSRIDGRDASAAGWLACARRGRSLALQH
jgi:hypothetical protein